MTITYPLSTPAGLGMRNISMRATNVVGIDESPFTKKQQVFEYEGKAWSASVTLPPLTRADAQKWIGFLLSLKGPVGTFILKDPSRSVPLGSASSSPGTPLVMGAGQTGNQIAIDGLPALASGYLLAGDYIQINTGAAATLHTVLSDADTDGSGQATLDIWPDIRQSPADNATIVVTDCGGLFRLTTRTTEWSVDEAMTFGISFDATEVLV